MSLGVTFTAGIRLYVAQTDTYPLTYFEGINISPGKEVTIKMTETDVTHLASPYGPCTSQQYLDPNDPTSHIYTQEACMTLCRQQQYVEICNCIVTYEAFTSKQQEAVNYKFCASKLLDRNTSDVFNRVEDAMCDYFLWGDNDLCDCPPPCTEIKYGLETSIADWPNPANQLA